MNLFAISGSLRSGSFNRTLIVLAAAEARRQGAQVVLGDFRNLAPPLYDYDREVAEGFPPEAQALIRHIEQAEGILIATPEYNNSVPGPFKNAIDWVSRVKPYRFLDKPVLLMGASSGFTGARKGMAALHIALAYQGAAIHPEVVSVQKGGEAFGPDGAFTDPTMAATLARVVGDFLASMKARATGAPEAAARS
jgi:NAD(P)H-dependent FMN reductase